MKRFGCIIILFFLVFSGFTQQTPQPTQSGSLWIEPSNQLVSVNSSFQSTVRLNSGTDSYAVYTLSISYDPVILRLDDEKGDQGVEAGAEGFVSLVENSIPGTVRISGFDAQGQGPGSALAIVEINWVALAAGTTDLIIDVSQLENAQAQSITVVEILNSTVEVIVPACGDADRNGVVSIVDALLVAQAYVGIHPEDYPCGWDRICPFDVDGNGYINIIDALIIAQYYIGLRFSLNCS